MPIDIQLYRFYVYLNESSKGMTIDNQGTYIMKLFHSSWSQESCKSMGNLFTSHCDLIHPYPPFQVTMAHTLATLSREKATKKGQKAQKPPPAAITALAQVHMRTLVALVAA